MPQLLLQQDLPMDAEISTEGLKRNRIFVQLQSSFLNIFTNYKGEIVTLQWYYSSGNRYYSVDLDQQSFDIVYPLVWSTLMHLAK